MVHSIVNLTKFHMIVIGFWKIPLTENVWHQKLYKYYSHFALISILLYTIMLTIRLIQLVIEGQTPNAKLYRCFTINIVIYMMTANLIIFRRYGLPDLISEVITDEEASLNSPDKDIRNAYLAQTKVYQFTSVAQVVSTFASGLTFIALNVYMKLKGLLQHEAFMYELWFPFSRENHEGFVIFFNLYIVVLIMFCNVASRIIPQTMIIYANAQLMILQIRLKKAFDAPCPDPLVKVQELVKKHQDLIKSVQILVKFSLNYVILFSFITFLNSALRNVIFMEYIINAINVAAGLLQFITVIFNVKYLEEFNKKIIKHILLRSV